MAQTLKKIFTAGIDEVTQNYLIESWHVSQSVDAFTGTQAYDITLSGSLAVTGSVAMNGLSNTLQGNVLTYNSSTGLIYYTASSAFNVNNFYTSSVTQSITSSVVNNTINSSTINQTIISSSVNTPAPSNTYIQYNSGSGFGASIGFQYNYLLNSLKQGNFVAATGIYSHAEGNSTNAIGNYSHAEGLSNISNGTSSHAEGDNTNALGNASHSEGTGTTAIGTYSHAEGWSTSTPGDYSHAEGYATQASGSYSHTEGESTISTGIGSHAEGILTNASGTYAHAEGYYTIAQGIASHAEGYLTYARGNYSHAEGYQTTSSGHYSHAEGLSTIAGGQYQHAIGQYNIADSTVSSFIIGNGTSNILRKNLIFASGSSFQISGSLNLSGSFSPQYRNTGSVEVPNASSGILLSKSDYNVVFTATTTSVGNKNAIQLPSGMDVGSIIYLQRISGTSACTVSGSLSHTINGAAGFTFPTTVYTRRMFVFNGSGWYVEV